MSLARHLHFFFSQGPNFTAGGGEGGGVLQGQVIRLLDVFGLWRNDIGSCAASMFTGLGAKMYCTEMSVRVDPSQKGRNFRRFRKHE